jgi:hypothetical protein
MTKYFIKFDNCLNGFLNIFSVCNIYYEYFGFTNIFYSLNIDLIPSKSERKIWAKIH